MITPDQQLTNQNAGQADWDSGLNSNFTILDRGQHTVYRAALAINTGDVLWSSSGGFCSRYDPNSEAIRPHAISYVAAASGDSIAPILWGIARSMSFGATIVPGRDYFVSAASPGIVVGSYSAAAYKIGYGGSNGALVFQPRGVEHETITQIVTVVINPTSTHFFTIDIGKRGWVRDLLMKSNSANLVGLAFYSNSARDNLMYQTVSGGVTTVSSFIDRAGWPYENTDASTLNGILYGKIWPDSGAAVASQAVQIALVADRWR